MTPARSTGRRRPVPATTAAKPHAHGVRRSNVAAPAPNCQVTELAAEAARVMRIIDRLHDDKSLVDQLNESNYAPAASDLVRAAYDELSGIETIVSHRQARAPRGALFQMLIALREAEALPVDCLGASHVSRSDDDKLREKTERVRRLLYSASYAMAGDLDDDLKLLLKWYAPRGFHNIAVANELRADPFGPHPTLGAEPQI